MLVMLSMVEKVRLLQALADTTDVAMEKVQREVIGITIVVYNPFCFKININF